MKPRLSAVCPILELSFNEAKGRDESVYRERNFERSCPLWVCLVREACRRGPDESKSKSTESGCQSIRARVYRDLVAWNETVEGGRGSPPVFPTFEIVQTHF